MRRKKELLLTYLVLKNKPRDCILPSDIFNVYQFDLNIEINYIPFMLYFTLCMFLVPLTDQKLLILRTLMEYVVHTLVHTIGWANNKLGLFLAKSWRL